MNPVSLLKKELDITVFTVDQTERYVFELKYPRAGQYPEQMFKACLDIAFLEQLVHRGFSGGYFVIVGDDPLLWSGRHKTGIYKYFRSSEPIHGHIRQPTGSQAQTVQIAGCYLVDWRVVDEPLRYAVIEVKMEEGVYRDRLSGAGGVADHGGS